MLRHILTAILTLGMVIVFSRTIYAAQTQTEVIPVSGYTGPDKEIVTPGVIYVEVPTQLIFAAFAGDGGMVTSPKYTISNLSAHNDVKVVLESFTQNNADAVPMDGLLSLKLLTHDFEELLPDVFPHSGPQTLVERLPRLTEGGTANTLGFHIGGTWGGSFDTERLPSFEMTLQFTVVS